MGGRATIFTPEEDAVLRRLYAEIGAAGCARRIDKTIKQIWNRAYILGVGKAGKRRIADRGHRTGRPLERFDHQALSDALGVPASWDLLPGAQPSRIHRLVGGS